MAVGIDESGQQRPPAAVDRVRDVGQSDQFGMLDDLADLALGRDGQRAESFELAVRADLDAVDVADQSIGGRGGGGDERCGEREEDGSHGRVA